MRKALVFALALGLGGKFWGGKPERPAPREVASVDAPTPTATAPELSAAKAGDKAPTRSSSAKVFIGDDAFAAERTRYRELHGKAFMSDAEQAEYDALLKNRELLETLPATLVTYAATPAALNEQDEALDLLTEALRRGDRSTAERGLGQVIADRQIEEASRPENEREQLAGVKGEVLFQWLSVQAGDASRLEAMLPGPVSRKVWDNVAKVERDNREISVALVGGR